jgi:Na+-transporting NADH:ubiquinone oxidoreductase subunit F
MFPVVTLLISVGAISALAAFLAILMVIADATIANYGEVKLTVNEDTEYVVKGGLPLLSTLMGQGIFIPSACGGRGSCGLCKVKVPTGAGQYLPTELPWIDEEEMRESVRLSCQFKVKNDLQLLIPEELFNVREFTTRVAKIRDLTHDIKELTLELIDPKEIEFKAGQFVQFMVPEYELTDESVYRAYSISSSSADRGIIELEIRLVPNGICTTYIHRYLKEGDEVVVNGPYGEFHLRESESDIIFIAGGSGMAPIKSILLDMLERGISRKATYFFGAVSLRDLFFLDEMRELESKMPNFTYIPALSAPKSEDNWDGEVGLITEVVGRHLETGENLEAYLCGSPGMIDACVVGLEKKGVPQELIFFDKFA